MLERIKANQRQIQLTHGETKLQQAVDRVRSIYNALLKKLRAAIGYLSRPKVLKMMFKFARTAYAAYRFLNMVITLLENLL